MNYRVSLALWVKAVLFSGIASWMVLQRCTREMSCKSRVIESKKKKQKLLSLPSMSSGLIGFGNFRFGNVRVTENETEDWNIHNSSDTEGSWQKLSEFRLLAATTLQQPCTKVCLWIRTTAGFLIWVFVKQSAQNRYTLYKNISQGKSHVSFKTERFLATSWLFYCIKSLITVMSNQNYCQ